MTPSIPEQLREQAGELDFFLGRCLKGKHIPCSLVTAMEYSLLSGGKRLRPALFLSWAELCGLDRGKVLFFAAGIECIHTYSLIHDDLPAMDNDDLRRGRPSNHKKFNEATAILAGDGLLTEAFTLMFKTDLPAERVCLAADLMSRAAGPRGMVGGQHLDMELTGRVQGVENIHELQTMHAMKTGALIRASCLAAAILAQAPEETREKAAAYGQALGLAFQITDDILDVTGTEENLGKPVGSDQAGGKATYPALVGLKESRILARQAIDQALSCLKGLESRPRAEFLTGLARYILERSS
jgi:geranylgeranyl diphosphate synthase type II